MSSVIGCSGVRIACVAAMLASAASTRCSAADSHAAWMWSQPGHYYGAANFLGVPEREEEVLTKIDGWNFDRAYVSYGNLTLSNPAGMAHWNKSLHNDGVESQLLLGENTWIYPPQRTSLLSLVQTRLVNFNVSRDDPTERINGLHLDIEPQGLSNWSTSTPTERKEMLYLLSDTYTAVRAQLDNNGGADVPIYADLPVWFDSSTSIGWDNSAERDLWYAGISESLAGISLMAFERRTLSSIVSGVDWEVQNLPIEVRIGLNAAEIGPGQTFADTEAFEAMVESLKQHYGDAIGGIDYQPFYTYADKATVADVSADFDADGDVDGADFLSWQQGFGSLTPPAGDANANGLVNRHDLSVWESQYTDSASASLALVPEPNTVGLLFGALFSLAAIRSGSLLR